MRRKEVNTMPNLEFDVKDMVIDPIKTLGGQILLVQVSPVKEYLNGRPTDKITGYDYIVASPEKKLKKLPIRIDGKQLIAEPRGFVEVQLSGLEIFLYWSQKQNGYCVGAKATGISVVDKKG